MTSASSRPFHLSRSLPAQMALQPIRPLLRVSDINNQVAVIKSIFSIFLSALAESHKLEDRFRITTTWLGWATVAVSSLLLVSIMYAIWLVFGLPLEGGPIEGLRLKLISAIVLTILLIPITFFAGMILVYGAYGFLMVLSGRFTMRQAVNFACYAKYPEHWYKMKV